MDALELAEKAKKQNIIDMAGHQAQILEKGGSWRSAIVIALKSFKKSSSEGKKRRKSWPVGKGKRIKL